MKKTIISLFAFLALSVCANAQVDLYTTGIYHNAWAAQGSNYGSDSLHTFGTVALDVNGRHLDSINVIVVTQDSIDGMLLMKVINPAAINKNGDTASVSFQAMANSKLVVVNTSGINVISWANIVAAHKAAGVQFAQAVAIYFRVCAVGTEVQKSNKKIWVKVNRYMHAK